MKTMIVLCFSLQTNTILIDIAGCDINLTVTETKQYIATEGYPNNYKNNQDCEFNFMAPSGRKIIVQFEDFNLEYFHDFLIFRKLHIIDIHTQLYINVMIIQWKQVKTTTFTINRLKF